jgi:hypothetical protein
LVGWLGVRVCLEYRTRAGCEGCRDVSHAELGEHLEDVLGHVEGYCAGGVVGDGGSAVLGGYVIPGHLPVSFGEGVFEPGEDDDTGA